MQRHNELAVTTTAPTTATIRFFLTRIQIGVDVYIKQINQSIRHSNVVVIPAFISSFQFQLLSTRSMDRRFFPSNAVYKNNLTRRNVVNETVKITRLPSVKRSGHRIEQSSIIFELFSSRITTSSKMYC